MAAIFGHSWTSAYGDTPEGLTGDMWAKTLSGVTPEQLARGLHETIMLASDYPPSAGRFRALCFGIPSIALVKRIMKKRELDAFVALVHQHLDTYAFTRADQRTADRMLAEAYETASDHVMRGGALPDIDAQQLEAPKGRPSKIASEETVKRNMDVIMRTLSEADAKAEQDLGEKIADEVYPPSADA
jgi:hypothetical protein